jgi:CheY-like chemotaxis protein
VLIVEDDPDNLDSMRRLLLLWGHDVAVASDGTQALAAVREFRPDAVLCDLELVGALDGLGLAAAIRADPALGSPLLVALTGLGQPGDFERSHQAGFNSHLTKPADMTTLRRLLEDARPS